MPTILPPPNQEIARRVACIPLPPYRYIPGILPHPIRHEGGHLREQHLVFEVTEPWWEDQGWLYGQDLFDHRFYWESHEVWEYQWKQTTSLSHRYLLQELIKSAASILKRHMNHQRPAELLWNSAQKLFALVDEDTRGLDLDLCVARIERFHQGGAWPLLASSP